jgi:tetratricopeptide (TPR) repeat protein
MKEIGVLITRDCYGMTRRLKLAIVGGIVLVVIAAAAVPWRIDWRRRTDPVSRAEAAYARGDWQEALERARGHLRAHPADTKALRLVARSSIRLGRESVGRSIYGQLGGLDALPSEDLYLLGTLLLKRGEREAAEHCWEKGLDAEPGHAPTLEALARSRLEDNGLVSAAGLAVRLAAQPEWNARGDFLLGQIREAQGELEAAVACWRRALRRDPDARGASSPPSWYRKRLVRALLRLGRPGEALRELSAIAPADKDPEVDWLFSRGLLQEGRLVEAEKAWTSGKRYREEHALEPEPAPYLGADRCAECHRSTHRLQRHSLHGQTSLPVAELAPPRLPRAPVVDPFDSDWSYDFARREGSLNFESRRGDATFRAVIEHVFGSGDRGQTLVGRDPSGRMRECRISLYAEGPVWDLTTGHPPVPPPEEHRLGRALSEDEVRGCFACHATDARAARTGQGPTAHDRGIGCERCHGPGADHLAAVGSESYRSRDLAIARPSRASAAEVVTLCGECHARRNGPALRRDDPAAVRFQATTLTWSRCYTDSGGRLDCRTCHDAHRDAETSPAYYEKKCLECHGQPVALADSRGKDARGARGVSCPVNASTGCLGCHMPPVKGAVPHTAFSDHFIRVRTGDDPPQSVPNGAGFVR